MPEEIHPPICDYEGSDYQTRFWEKGGREYEDRCEAIALARLLPKKGNLLLELGAGAGRNTVRYAGFNRVVLLDYSRSQLIQAQERLGKSDRYIYVAADIYRLPFIDNLFDSATMIRVIHHMADAPAALDQIHNVLQSKAVFILEFANKKNWKAILSYLLKHQGWNPFTREPVEFVPLNFDFHPTYIKEKLEEVGFKEDKVLTVSHFRIGILKRTIPPATLAGMDSILQWTGAFMRLTPSVFVKAREVRKEKTAIARQVDVASFFKCPDCGHSPLSVFPQKLNCPSCNKDWNIIDGIYDFRSE